MRNDFYSGLTNERQVFQGASKCEVIFSNCWGCVGKEEIFSNGLGRQKRNVFQQPSQQKRNEFSNSWARLKKRKKRLIILHISQSRYNKDEIFKLAPVDTRIIMSLAQARTNVNVPMKCVFSIHYRIINKNLLIFIIIIIIIITCDS